MMRRCRKLNSGFTLIELLVVISIIGMLAALLLPAVNAARESGRRAVCNSSTRQLSMATLNFESGRNRFPGSRENLGGNPVSGTTAYPVSWHVSLMPYMERNDVYDAYQAQGQTTSTSGTVTNPPAGLPIPPYLKVLRCLSDPPANSGATQSYICNAGYVNSDATADGLFLDGIPTGTAGSPTYTPPTVRSSSIYDGQSNTLMISETLLAQVWSDVTLVQSSTSNKINNCFVWQCVNDGAPGLANTNLAAAPVTLTAMNSMMKINGQRSTPPVIAGTPPVIPSVNWLRPSSNHPAGVNSGFADGHTQFLRDNISYYVYWQLMTPNYKKSVNVPVFYILQDSDFE